MPKSKYDTIYKTIKKQIENGYYKFQSFLPSENTLVGEFNSSRNTIRRAIADLIQDGYVQALHGKGVQVIFEPTVQSLFTLDGIESFSEATKRINMKHSTKVILFLELYVDEDINKLTGFEIGKEIYYIQRVRIINNTPVIIDHNYFLKDIVKNLTKEIAENSIYHYLENELNINITTSKKSISVEPKTENDDKYLELNELNCIAAVSSNTYNSDGIMFEFTQSRHSPKHFVFRTVNTRIK